jgi:hypothetical protein
VSDSDTVSKPPQLKPNFAKQLQSLVATQPRSANLAGNWRFSLVSTHRRHRQSALVLRRDTLICLIVVAVTQFAKISEELAYLIGK